MTASLTPGDASIRGNWGKIATSVTSATAASSQNQIATQGGTAFLAGNRLMFGCRAMSTALSSAQLFQARLRHSPASTGDIRAAGERITYASPGGLIYLQECAADAGITYVQSKLEIATRTGDVSFAPFTTYDLTAMGVTDASGRSSDR